MSDALLMKLLLFLLALFFVVVGYYNYSVISNYMTLNYLTTNGVLVKGKVVASDNSYSKSGEVYYLTYQYRPENLNVTITTEKKVDGSLYGAYSNIGDKVNILYDPKDPTISDVEGNEAFVFSLTTVFMLDAVLIWWSIWIYRY